MPVPPAVPPSAAAAAAAPASAPPLSALGSREPPAPPPRPAAAAPSAAIRHRNFPAPAPHGTRRGGGGPGAARGCSGAPGPPRPRLGPARRRPAGGRLGAAAPHKLLCPRRGECAGPSQRARGGGRKLLRRGWAWPAARGARTLRPQPELWRGRSPTVPGARAGVRRALQAEQCPEGAAPQSAGAWGGFFVLGSGRRPVSLGGAPFAPGSPLSAAPGAGGRSCGAAGSPVGEGSPIHPGLRPARPGPGGRAAARRGVSAGRGPAAAPFPRRRNCQGSRRPSPSPPPRPEREDRAGGAFGVWGSPLVWRLLQSAAWGGCRPVAPGLGGRVTPDSRPGPCSRRDFPHWGPVLGTGWGCVFGRRWPPGT